MSDVQEKSEDVEKGVLFYEQTTTVTAVPAGASQLQNLHDDVPRNKGVFAKVCSRPYLYSYPLKHSGSYGSF